MSQTTIQQARFRVEAEVLLPAGWLDGTFVVPETQSLQDFSSAPAPSSSSPMRGCRVTGRWSPSSRCTEASTS